MGLLEKLTQPRRGLMCITLFRRYKIKNLIILIKISFVCILASISLNNSIAATGTWNIDDDGNWVTASNWAGDTIADGAGSIANFTYNITTNRIVTVDSSRTIGRINFGGQSSQTGIFWNLSSGSLTLDNSGSTPVIDVATTVIRGEIESSISGAAGFNKTGNNVLEISGDNTISGDATVAGGILSVYNNHALKNADVIVSGGILDIGDGVNMSNKTLTVSGSGQIQARKKNSVAGINAPLSINKEAAIYIMNSVQNAILNIYSNVTMTANAGFELGGCSNTLNINKSVSGAYNFKLKGNSDDPSNCVRFNLNATNTYTGNTFFEAWACSATFELNSHYCLPSTTELNLNINTGSGSDTLHLDLNDYTQLVAKLIINAGAGTYIEMLGNENGVIVGKLSASGTPILLNGGTIIINDEAYIGAAFVVSNATFINNYRWASGNGNINIYTGGKIGGVGKFDGVVTNHSNGTISPGDEDAIGTLYINNKLVMNAGSFYDWKISGSNVDSIDVNLTLTLPVSENSITVNVDRISAVNGTYTLISSGGITGGDETAFYSDDENVSFSKEGNNIKIGITPEPTIIWFFGLIVLSLIRLSVRR